MATEPLIVALVDNSATFRRYLEPVLGLLAQALGRPLEIHTTPGRPSTLVFSSFEQWHRGEGQRTSGLRICLCGEPTPVPRQPGLALLIDCKRGLNAAYLPFCVLSFAERFKNRVEDLLLPKQKAEIPTKTAFCAYLYTQSYKVRENLFMAINAYRKVDVLGKNMSGGGRAAKPPLPPTHYYLNRRRAFLKPGQKKPSQPAPPPPSLAHFDRALYIPGQQTYNDSAVAKYRSYKFVICCENSSLPGYVTEKIVSAMLAHSIPIYWGSHEIVSMFNPKSFIDAMQFPSLSALVERIQELDQSPEKYEAMFLEPWFVTQELPEIFQPSYLVPTLAKLLGSDI